MIFYVECAVAFVLSCFVGFKAKPWYKKLILLVAWIGFSLAIVFDVYLPYPAPHGNFQLSLIANMIVAVIFYFGLIFGWIVMPRIRRFKK